MNTQKIKILLATATLAALLTHGAWAENAPATDSLPPLVDGKIPTNMDELWGNYNPTKEPLETEVVRKWKEEDITMPPDPHLDHHRGQPSPRDRP